MGNFLDVLNFNRLFLKLNRQLVTPFIVLWISSSPIPCTIEVVEPKSDTLCGTFAIAGKWYSLGSFEAFPKIYKVVKSLQLIFSPKSKKIHKQPVEICKVV